jgi:hypothetical protein
MANPTTNYGFVLPTPTDLVTDLPADFDVALQGVDTRLKALQPGTTLGDLAYSSATANTNTRLAVGSTGNVLTVAGGVPTWAAPATGGGMTVLASGSLPTGTGVFTLSSISGSYLDLQLVLRNIQVTSTAACLQTLNNDTGAYYNPSFMGGNSSSVENVYNATSVNINYNANIKNGANKNTLVQNFYDYTDTTSRKVWNSILGYQNSFGSEVTESFVASYNGTAAAITRIDMTFGSNITAGTYILYGVK